jgi:hypothetical protein
VSRGVFNFYHFFSITEIRLWEIKNINIIQIII